jgi:hypothetical protein
MDITYLGSAIWSYNFFTRVAIFKVTVPATIIRSDCRGVARGTMPNRDQSYRDAPVAIISMAQHANPNVIGQSEDSRAQLTK